MLGKHPAKIVVGLTALALFTAACGGGGDESDDSAAQTGGEILAYLGEPEHLIPGNTNESEGSAVLREVYQGLVDYNDETGEPEMAIAESITPDQSQKVWTIKIKSGYTFDNGEPVNADAFIRAWNWTAYGPNAAGNSYFFDRIVGYNEMQSEDPDGDGPQKAPAPAANTLSGLKKVDDSTIEVTLAEPFSAFGTMLGYNAFFPLADACVKDIKACEEKPIGNGPFKFETNWEHNVQIKLVRSDTYGGEKAKADRLTFKIYDSIDTGYNDLLAGNIDIMDSVPPAKYKDAKAQFPKIIEKPTTQFTYLGFPLAVKPLDNKLIRQALSLAVDRKTIISTLFDGRFVQAKSYVSPAVAGSRENACTEFCDYNPTRAKELLAQAGGWPAGQKLQIWFNAGAGHETWTQAIGDGWKKDLGIDYELKGNLQFAQYLETADAKKFTGPFRLGWLADYPSPENYLKPLYGTQGTSNNTGYTNQQFDNLIKQGDAATSKEESLRFYQQAEDLVLQDLPVIPLWFGQSSAVFSDKLDNVVWNRINELEYSGITVNK